MIRGRPLRAIAVACLAALHCASPGTAAPTGQVISNTATLQWDSSAGPQTRSSNQVDIPVVTNAQPLTFWRPTSGFVPADVLSESCGSGPPPASSLASLPSQSTTELNGGRALILTLDLPSANANAGAVDSIVEEVTTSTGDTETLKFTETGVNTGIFKAAIVTRTAPNPLTVNDCHLNVDVSGQVSISVRTLAGGAIAAANLNILADPYGITFDSRSGTPVSGVRVTLIDTATGQPAQVFGDDGISTFPATLITGQSVTDGSGAIYAFGTGEYRFPFVAPGNYSLTIAPVQPYSFPSTATPADLSSLVRPDGNAFTITGGSYGAAFALAGASAVRIDVPLDPPAGAITLAKTASRGEATIGDLVQYSVTLRNDSPDVATGGITVRDQLPLQMRFRPGSARLAGQKIADPATTDGQALTFTLPSLAPGATALLTYLTEIRPDARSGSAVNRVTATSGAGASNTADATVRILKDDIADRMTIGGSIVLGDCGLGTQGIANVRVLLEDGSYAVSDLEGRFHFEGVTTGSHVVALDRSSVPAGLEPIDCARDARSAGNPASRLVDGLGGQFKTLTFHLGGTLEADAAAGLRHPEAASDAAASGAERDWLAGQAPGIGWLFPEADYNPRAPVLRVAIKHKPGQKVELLVDDRVVDPSAFDGTVKNAEGVAVSQWRGIPLGPHTTSLRAIVRDANGAVAETLVRKVVFANSAAKASLVADESSLIADGVHKPVIAVRLTNRDGRPVRHGLVGDFGLSAPYFAAIEAHAEQVRQLAGLERAQPTWRVDGDTGMAYIELEPTTVSGTAVLTFRFRDGDRVREQRVEVWLNPGDRPWTLVGLAEGSIGFNRIDKKMERLGHEEKDATDGRIALYAKGRIKGEWLLTLAYDSDKKKSDNRLGGTIDPNAYYTVYADRSERRYEAASVRKLYVKLERPQFAALFGDYETAIDEPELARHVRSFNGIKAEYRSKQVSALAFGADDPQRHRRDEIQGNGLSGPYPLGARDILANSERITLEVRDRFHSERIVDQRVLTRYTDYEIDYAAGTLRFREPILSRDSSLNPQFIVADYEADGTAEKKINAGARIAWRSADERLQVAATAIHDANSSQLSNLGGVDVRFRPDASTEVRAEAALSRTHVERQAKGEVKKAWLVEVERHDGAVDILAYARSRQSGFGLGQTNASEDGTLKIGADASVRIGERLSITGSAWRDDYLDSDARRLAGRGLLEYRKGSFSARGGFVFANDRLADGTTKKSSLLELGTTGHLVANRLELDASTQIPIGGNDGSVDFPARHRLTGRFAVTHDVALVASYEIANGDAVKARTARLGFDLAPWAGARISIAGNLQNIDELGTRSFAAFGLSQSVTLGEHWTLDASFDGNRTIGGIDPQTVLNPLHPVASGGFIGNGSMLTEDFAAATIGATYRADLWTLTGRAEYRDGEKENRTGLILGGIRQLGDGQALGGSLDWYRANSKGGAESEVASARLSWAYRPAGSTIAFLDKLEFRLDRVTGAVLGQSGPLGSIFSVEGDARSMRLINNFSASLHRLDDRAELNVFWGARFASDRFGSDDVKGLSNLVALEGRLSIRQSMELGFAGTVRHSLDGNAIAWSFGPQLGFAPVKGSLMTVGYNFAGYHDRDFEEDRYTRSGAYATFRFKFDELTLEALGLGRR